ncbi:hypothetical protein CDD83_4244 [Cordyceps sp. RAO-2017]|nr:hypothetical protein CDD83_4244 [Cordyceps sp. RAO-2017]
MPSSSSPLHFLLAGREMMEYEQGNRPQQQTLRSRPGSSSRHLSCTRMSNVVWVNVHTYMLFLYVVGNTCRSGKLSPACRSGIPHLARQRTRLQAAQLSASGSAALSALPLLLLLLPPLCRGASFCTLAVWLAWRVKQLAEPQS